jgi:serine/threonine protein kinase
MPDNERERRLEELHSGALKLDASERDEFLRLGCGGDADLRQAVDSLLGYEQKLDGFLEYPPQRTETLNASLDREPSQAGQTLGPYHLLQPIGSGGMGEVWLAEQRQPMRRRVAIKLIKAGMDTREVVARFESERQALALMEHPGIAKIFDAGATPQGRPYFVMEYVTGIPITQYCDRHKLTTRERLQLFICVCEGVQHAHQKAIIHRDLKPSNILVGEVDGKPVPRIIDFGLAKATAQPLTAETMFTRAGAIVGTPAYMSPEQAGSTGVDVDTRADVYSLGVVLYELLVGALPLEFHKLAFDEILRRMRDEDAPRPSTRLRTRGEQSATAAQNRGSDLSTLARQLRGDLDAIALKALEKERSRRYATPSELGADIGRHLRNEPVLARSPSAAYRTRKYIRRHWVGVAVAVGLPIALAIVLLAVDLRWVSFKTDQLATRSDFSERQLTFNTPENVVRGVSEISPDGKQLAYLDTKGPKLRVIDTGEIRDIPLPPELQDRFSKVTWFPDGKKVLLTSILKTEGSPILATSIFGGTPRTLRKEGWLAAASPQGSAVAFIGGQSNEIWVMGPNGENARKICTSGSQPYTALAWSPTGQRLAFIKPGSDGGGSLETVALEGGLPRVVVSDPALESAFVNAPLGWSRDGRIIFAFAEQGSSGTNLWSIVTDARTGRPSGRPTKITNWGGIFAVSPSMSMDGSRLAVGKIRFQLDVYVADLSEKGTRLEDPRRLTVSDSIDSPDAWTRDGNAVLFDSNRTGNIQLFRQQLGQDTARRMIGGSDDETDAALSPDGAWVLYWATKAGKSPPATKRLMRLPTSGGPPELVLEIANDPDSLFDCSSAPGGLCIFSRREEGRSVFYALDPQHGVGKELARVDRAIQEMPGANSKAHDFATSPEGGRIAILTLDQSDHRIDILDLRNGGERSLPLPKTRMVGSLAWASDGSALFASLGGVIIRVELDGRTHVILDSRKKQWYGFIHPSPDGRYLAFGSEPSQAANIWLLENF